MFDMKTDNNYSVEDLGNNIKVVCSDEHRFGTDALLLYAFASPKNNDAVCDLGSGCGIISMLTLRDCNPQLLYAVEIQEKACRQIEKSLEISNLTGKAEVINKDLNRLLNSVPLGAFNLVIMNPPYKAADSGILSESEADKTARHETKCTMSDVAEISASLLNFSGRLCVCQRPERLCDTIEAFRNNGIEPKRLRFVSKNKNKEPWLFLLEGKKGSKPFLRIEPVLYTYNDDGTESDELKKATGLYAAGENNER